MRDGPNPSKAILKNNWFWGERNRLDFARPARRSVEDAAIPISRRPRPRHGSRAHHCRRRSASTADRDRRSDRPPRRYPRRAEVRGAAHRGLAPAARPIRANSPVSRSVDQTSPGRSRPAAAPIGTDPGGRLRLDPDRDGRDGSFESCERERALLALTDYDVGFPRPAAACQPRQRQLLSARRARPGRVRRADRSRRRPPPPSVDAALLRASSERDARARHQHRRLRHRQHRQHRQGARADGAGCRRLLPARVLLDQHASRRTVPQAHGAGEAARTSTFDRGPDTRRRPKPTWRRRASMD